MEFTKKFNNEGYLKNAWYANTFIYNIKKITSNSEIKSKVKVKFNGKTFSMPEEYNELSKNLLNYFKEKNNLNKKNSNNLIPVTFKVIVEGKDEKEIAEELEKYKTIDITIVFTIIKQFFANIVQFFKNIFNKNKTKD